MNALEIANEIIVKINEIQGMFEIANDAGLIKQPGFILATSNFEKLSINNKDIHIEKSWIVKDKFVLRDVINSKNIEKKRFMEIKKLDGKHLDWKKPVYLIFALNQD